jgi:hypothetical protein
MACGASSSRSSRLFSRASQGLLFLLFLGLVAAGLAAGEGQDWWAEGKRREEQGLKEEAADCFVKALLADPKEERSAAALARLFYRGPPSSLPGETPGLLPLPTERIECQLSGAGDPAGAASSSEPGQSFWTTGVLFPEAWQRAGPLPGWKVNRVQYGYFLDPAEGRWKLRFLLLFPSPGLSPAGADHGRLAAAVRRAISDLYWLGKRYLGLEPPLVGGRVSSIWVCEGARSSEDRGAAAETIGNSIYLYQVLAPRAPAEWWRELAHEYGHVVLPGVGAFPAPDPWANGVLGELLFTRWLLAAPMAKEHPWTREMDREGFERSQVQPRLELFRREGPASPLAGESSARSLDYFLGAALEAEGRLGREGLAKALGRMRQLRGARTSDFLRAVQEAKGGT